MLSWIGGRRLLLAVGVVVMVGVAGVAWQWRPLVAWHTLRQLRQAGDADRDAWVARAAQLGESADATLLAWMAEPAGVEPARAVFAVRAAALPAGDPARVRMVVCLREAFARCDPAGQAAGLELAADALVPADGAAGGEARGLAAAGLVSPVEDVRAAAVRLAARPEVGEVGRVAALLRDPAASVRRAAVLALADAPDLAPTDDLLHWLHDSDAGVRQVCEVVLRNRGLRPIDLDLGRHLTDPEPLTRLGVLELLADDLELDPKPWLDRLRADAEPAVRAAAVRSADVLAVDYRQELAETATNDPDPTVRRVAAYELRSVSRGE